MLLVYSRAQYLLSFRGQTVQILTFIVRLPHESGGRILSMYNALFLSVNLWLLDYSEAYYHCWGRHRQSKRNRAWQRLKSFTIWTDFLRSVRAVLCFILKMNHLLWFGGIKKCSFMVFHGHLEWLCCIWKYVSEYTLEIVFSPGIHTNVNVCHLVHFLLTLASFII